MNYNLAKDARNRYLKLIETTVNKNEINYFVYNVLITPPGKEINIYQKRIKASFDYEDAILPFIESTHLELRLLVRNENTQQIEIISFEYKEYD